MAVLLNSHRYAAASFFPTDIANLAGWYVGELTDQATPGGAVSVWADLSGLGRDVTQGTGSFQPTMQTGGPNSRKVVRFDGADNYLRSAGFTTITQPITVFCLAKMSGAPSGTGVMIDGSTAQVCMLYASSGGTWRIFAGSSEVAGAATDTTTWHTHVAVFDGASSKIRRNGGAGTTGNPGTGGLAAFTVGANGSTMAGFFNGDMAELVIYARALTLAEINQVGQYLADSAAITWTTAT